MTGDSPSAAPGPSGEAEGAGKKYHSNKMRSHAKRKRERANERREHEAGGQPYDVRASTRLKHVHLSKPIDAKLNLADTPISAPSYIGLCDNEEKDTMEYKLEDVVGMSSWFKFKLVKWDGR